MAKLGDPFPCKVPHFVGLQINFQLVKDELDKIALAQNLKQRSVRGGVHEKGNETKEPGRKAQQRHGDGQHFVWWGQRNQTLCVCWGEIRRRIVIITPFRGILDGKKFR